MSSGPFPLTRAGSVAFLTRFCGCGGERATWERRGRSCPAAFLRPSCVCPRARHKAPERAAAAAAALRPGVGTHLADVLQAEASGTPVAGLAGAAPGTGMLSAPGLRPDSTALCSPSQLRFLKTGPLVSPGTRFVTPAFFFSEGAGTRFKAALGSLGRLLDGAHACPPPGLTV